MTRWLDFWVGKEKWVYGAEVRWLLIDIGLERNDLGRSWTSFRFSITPIVWTGA
jgi:hypothetical protein